MNPKFLMQTDNQDLFQQVVRILRDTAVVTTDHEVSPETRLWGALPELDSLSLMRVLMAIEQSFNVEILDGEIDAATFETVGTLLEFVSLKNGNG